MTAGDSKFHENIRKSLSESGPSFDEGSWNKLAPKLDKQNACLTDSTSSIWRNSSLIVVGVLLIGTALTYFIGKPNEALPLAENHINTNEESLKREAPKQVTEISPPIQQDIETPTKIEHKTAPKQQRTPKIVRSTKRVEKAVNKIEEKVIPPVEPIMRENGNAQPLIGYQKLYQYFADSIRYPEQLKLSGASGRIEVSFSVSKTGDISKIKVVSSTHADLNEEAIRILEKMPPWSPKIFNNKSIGSKVILPISFSFVAPTSED